MSVSITDSKKSEFDTKRSFSHPLSTESKKSGLDSKKSSTRLFSTDSRRSSAHPLSKSFEKTNSRASPIFIVDVPSENPVFVYFKGIDVTPEKLLSKKLKIVDIKHDVESENVPRATRKTSQITRFSSTAKVTFYTKRRITQASLTNLIADKNLTSFADTEEHQEFKEAVPSAMCLPYESSRVTFPEKIRLVLEETDTISLFELSSKTVTKGTEEANVIEKQNEVYDYLTVGKGKNRKRISTEAQTVEQILKTRHTNVSRTERRNNVAFASVWDMFDSYKKEQIADGALSQVTPEMAAVNKLYVEEGAEEQIQEITINRKTLLDATCMMERVLANNNFKVQQENYKGLLRFETGPLFNESYNYILKPLWSFKYGKIAKRPVTVVTVNMKNTDIIGVGYGKYKYTDNVAGAVCIWNIKNPTQPERFYQFETTVTSMDFSNSNPNLLAIGFYNGDIYILDITSYDKVVLAKSTRKHSPSYQPVWEVKWYYEEETGNGREQVMVINTDGRINTFSQTKTKDFIRCPMMKVMNIADGSKTMIDEKKCAESEQIPLFKTESCQIHCWHPELKDVYFVGTTGGCIYRCSINYLTTHVYMFRAHRGAINAMEFSKFCFHIFVTCGDDWTVKIWKEDINEPLIVLTTDMDPVVDVKFSPTHSTLIAGISGSKIYLWNIKHKIDTACLEQDLAPRLAKLMTIRFTENGRNIITSDRNGKVHMMYILGLWAALPNQGNILEQSIQNNLRIQPKLMNRIQKYKNLRNFL